jgi:hypothetical protein
MIEKRYSCDLNSRRIKKSRISYKKWYSDLKMCYNGQISDLAVRNFLNVKRSGIDIRLIRFCSTSGEESEYTFIMKFDQKMNGK